MSNEMIPDVQLEDNSSQRLPLVIIVDGSTSMSGKPIAELNAGLQALEEELKSDAIARLRVQLMILRVGGNDDVEVLTDWTDAINFSRPMVIANGNTPLGKAARLALSKIEDQKQNYKAAGIPYNRPWLYILSDGAPNDAGWESAADECRQAVSDRKVAVFAIATGGAQIDPLKRFTDTVLELNGVRFRELFIWLSRSASAASKARQGDNVQVALPPNVLTIPT